jgi:leader peptidase (prepilin peptidase) / N-methyltransferase
VRLSGVRISARLRLDVAGSAGLAAIAVLVVCFRHRPLMLATFIIVALVSVDVARTDLATRRIPNQRVVAIAALASAAAILGWSSNASPWSAVLGAVAAGGPVLVFHLASPAGMGFGDVKWATALGGVVGLVAWPLSVLVPLVGSLIALVMATVTRQRRVPFAPGLSAGALVAVTLGPFWIGGLR